MKCTEVRPFLHPFLDGELDVDKNVVVLQHLELCDCCRGRFEDEKRLLGRVQDGLKEACPAALRARLSAALDATAPAVLELPRRGHWRKVLVAASFFLAAGFGLGLADPFCWRGCTMVREIARLQRDLSADDFRILPGPAFKDALVNEVGYVPRIPKMPKCEKGAKQSCAMKGGCATTVKDRRTAVIRYFFEDGAGDVKFVCIPRARVHPWLEQKLDDGRVYSVARQDGVQFVGWIENEDLMGFVAPDCLPEVEPRLRRLAAQARSSGPY